MFREKPQKVYISASKQNRQTTAIFSFIMGMNAICIFQKHDQK